MRTGAGAAGVALVALVALDAAPLLAQTVGGLVRNGRTGGVVEHATIALRDPADSTVALARSDSLGTFYLTAPSPGTYTLRFNLGAGPLSTTPPIVLESVEAFHQGTYVIEVPDDVYFLESQVERQVTQHDVVVPKFPVHLLDRRVSGWVAARFVVDARGRVERASFEVVEASHREFADAVRDALPRLRFDPAEIRGRPVRQLVQQSFTFGFRSGTPSIRIEPVGAGTLGRGARPPQ